MQVESGLHFLLNNTLLIAMMHIVRFRLRIDRLNAVLSFILINGKQFGIVRFLFLYLLPL